MKERQETFMKAYDGIYNRFFKRIIGLVLALVSFPLVFPLYIIMSLAIFLEDGAPILYRPLRGGYKNKPFHIFKFRTMVKDADKIGGGTTANNDPRITKVGYFLRKTKLDETANLINIILGKMSFVGPRPELIQYTDEYSDKEKVIFEVRPGITDYSSIEYINLDEIVGQDNADEIYEKIVLNKKNQLRIKYAESVCFKNDCFIFFKTAWKVMGLICKYVFRGKHR